MSEIEQFLAVNGLKQIELANYLGLNKSTISQVVSGKTKLSQGKLNQLRLNDKGWDCSMFSEGRMVQTIGNTTIGNHSSNTQIIGENEALKRENELLKQLLEEKERTIQILMNK